MLVQVMLCLRTLLSTQDALHGTRKVSAVVGGGVMQSDCARASSCRFYFPRRAQNIEQMPDFSQKVLAAMREGQAAQARLEPNADPWPLPSFALFALQKHGWAALAL